jgi:hypothetical protein
VTPRPKRKAIPMHIKLEACLRLLGFDDADSVEWHHEPPLVFRPLNAGGTDTDPPMNDPRHIVPMASQTHRGRTPADLKTGAKVKRQERKESEHQLRMRGRAFLSDFMTEITKPKRPIPSRPFPKGQRKLRSRKAAE